jgi:trans-AT polyketide synthase/acyltransferase/oxidoreductase domain-containing protein
MQEAETLNYRTDAAAGWWLPGETPPEAGNDALTTSIFEVNSPIVLVLKDGHPAVATGGRTILGGAAHQDTGAGALPVMAYVPPLHPGQLGDPDFRRDHGLEYAYVAGAMANGITSVEMVEAVGRAGMLGFFGAAGLSIEAIEQAVDRLQQRLSGSAFGVNLIHSPNEPDHEAETVALYLRKGVRLISASAFLGLTLPLLHYRIKGIYRNETGGVVCPNRVVAKVSRVEVAEKFLSPPPEKMLAKLVAQGKITPEEAGLARFVPVADSLTAEADSGGHTDNRPALALLPTLMALRNQLVEKYGYGRSIHVGLGGGIATPESTAAAFAMGAAYVLTGSINQACLEAGTSEKVREMLAEARQADVAMAPAADMFEMGVKVQVLKRGTMFALRAAKLYDLYSRHDRFESIPAGQRALLEKDYFRCSFQTAWEQTRAFFEHRDPRQNLRAEQDPRHKMALVFRSYLGQSSGWATTGDPTREIDYQIWCGPAMGAFNEWTRGTFLERPENRKTVTVALNLMMGASVITRVNWLRNQGVIVPQTLAKYAPLTLSDLSGRLD